MDKHIEISENSLVAKLLECVFFLGALSLVLYAFIRSCKPIQNTPTSQIVYWVFIAIMLGLWVLALDNVLRTRRFEIGPGVVERYESRLVVFRFQKSYSGDMVKTVNVEHRSGHFLFKQKYDVVLLPNTGKKVNLKSFPTEKEASEFCSEVTDLLHKQTSQ